jgi:isocitrate lyase
MLTQMAKYLDTVYVSGWQSSSTASASDEPGPDLADYPYVRSLPCPMILKTNTTRLPSQTKFPTSSWHNSSTTASNAKNA